MIHLQLILGILSLVLYSLLELLDRLLYLLLKYLF